MNEKYTALDVNSIEQEAFFFLYPFCTRTSYVWIQIQISSYYISDEGLVWTNANSVWALRISF